jgi:hypothetical protein
VLGKAPPALLRTRHAASISFLGSAALMKARTALTLVSEMPPDGIREAFWICTNVALTKSLDVVPNAAFNLSYQRLCSRPAGRASRNRC